MTKRPIKDLHFESQTILQHAVSEHGPSKIFGLFSGGHDSLCATTVASFHPRFAGAVHINTGIGIEDTREFVRETCDEQGWPLIELHPDDKTYEELVLEKGFPHGPQSHNTMYHYLKQRQVRRLIREQKEYWQDRIGLVTGIRKKESDRRMKESLSVKVRRHGAQLWINPILYWSKLECNEFINDCDLRRNPVVDVLHKSGECLCGAYANPDEIDVIEQWFPEAAQQIQDLEEKAMEKGLVDHTWAVSQAPGKTWDDVDEDEIDLELCQDCPVDFTEEAKQ